jgi:hypothetical protein
MRELFIGKGHQMLLLQPNQQNLLINNCSAHEAGVEAIKTTPLQWTRVEFLPPNTTSLHQPCGQGIIRNFKAFCRRRWVKSMVEQAMLGKNPV